MGAVLLGTPPPLGAVGEGPDGHFQRKSWVLGRFFLAHPSPGRCQRWLGRPFPKEILGFGAILLGPPHLALDCRGAPGRGFSKEILGVGPVLLSPPLPPGVAGEGPDGYFLREFIVWGRFFLAHPLPWGLSGRALTVTFKGNLGCWAGSSWPTPSPGCCRGGP